MEPGHSKDYPITIKTFVSKQKILNFFYKRTNNIHKFEGYFLRGQLSSNGFKVFNGCIVEPKFYGNVKWKSRQECVPLAIVLKKLFWLIFDEELSKVSNLLKNKNVSGLMTLFQCGKKKPYKVQTLTTKDCKGPQTNMTKNVGSIKTVCKHQKQTLIN